MDNEILLKFLRKQIKKWAVYRLRVQKSLKTGKNTDLELLKEYAEGQLEAFLSVYYLLTIF